MGSESGELVRLHTEGDGISLVSTALKRNGVGSCVVLR